jgi:hypothetical protein
MLRSAETLGRSPLLLGVAGAVVGGSLVLCGGALALRSGWWAGASAADADARLARLESIAAAMTRVIEPRDLAAVESQPEDAVARVSALVAEQVAVATDAVRQLTAQVDELRAQTEAGVRDRRTGEDAGVVDRDAQRRLAAMESSLAKLATSVSMHDDFLRAGRLPGYADLRDLTTKLDRLQDETRGLARRVERLEARGR